MPTNTVHTCSTIQTTPNLHDHFLPQAGKVFVFHAKVLVHVDMQHSYKKGRRKVNEKPSIKYRASTKGKRQDKDV